ncbi:hypothetical protein [Vulcanisaeta distributa]|uniref:hypothetical protein n=1 Tax=Vulcanisaeta distributa TaxID=164451 RepID=UPI000A5F2174|nr:hypothetical protein [Vulcanisaeta distributa]
MADGLKITVTSAIALVVVILMIIVLVLPKPVMAQSNFCSPPIGGCNYEVTTNGVTPGFVSVTAVINNTMTVQTYTGEPYITLQYNPGYYMACESPSDGSTRNWVQGAVEYYVMSGYPGGPGSIGILYFTVWAFPCGSIE